MILLRDNSAFLTENLKLSEVACQCGKCKAVILDEKLLEAWGKLRKIRGSAIIITSGYRCQVHNAKFRPNSSLVSQHIAGKALDIDINSFDGWDDEIIDIVLKACGFSYWEINRLDGYVHMDVR